MSSFVKCLPESGGVTTIEVTGRFDFSLHREFRQAYADTVDRGAEVIVDLKGVEYVDSSALGMLLLLREYMGDDSAKISLANPSGDVRSILEVSNFEKLFKII